MAVAAVEDRGLLYATCTDGLASGGGQPARAAGTGWFLKLGNSLASMICGAHLQLGCTTVRTMQLQQAWAKGLA